MHAVVKNGVPEQIGRIFADATGTQHSRQVLSLWTETELAAIDVYPITDGPVPDGHVVTGSALEWDGETVTRVFTSEPAPAPSVDDFRIAVQSHIDATAQSRQYENGVSLASYRNDPNEAWANEAAAFIAWRSDVWAFVFGWMADVQAGTDTPPESTDALVAALPEMLWPA